MQPVRLGGTLHDYTGGPLQLPRQPLKRDASFRKSKPSPFGARSLRVRAANRVEKLSTTAYLSNNELMAQSQAVIGSLPRSIDVVVAGGIVARPVEEKKEHWTQAIGQVVCRDPSCGLRAGLFVSSHYCINLHFFQNYQWTLTTSSLHFSGLFSHIPPKKVWGGIYSLRFQF